MTILKNTSVVYDLKSKKPRGAAPLTGVLLGFQDCAESFRDWQRLRPWSRRYVDEQPVIQKVFFRMLGAPLDEPLSQHSTPWDDYLVFGGSRYVDTPATRQQYIEMVRVALGESHE